MKHKDLVFYCDACASEVPKDAKECPTCGRSFESVRCPMCGMTGETEVFLEGCPSCGYSVNPKRKTPKFPFKNPFKRAGSAGKARPGALRQTLPLWVYVVTGIIFFGVMLMMYRHLA